MPFLTFHGTLKDPGCDGKCDHVFHIINMYKVLGANLLEMLNSWYNLRMLKRRRNMNSNIRKIIAIFMTLTVVALYSFNLQGIGIYATEETLETMTEQTEMPDQDMQNNSDAAEDSAVDDSEAGSETEPSDEAETEGDPAEGEPAADTEENAGKTLRAAGEGLQAQDESGEAGDGTAGDEDIDMSDAEVMEDCDFIVKGSEGSYEFDKQSGVLYIRGDAVVAMKEGAENTPQRIIVESDCKLTLNGASIEAEGGPAIKINAGVNTTMTLASGSTNKVVTKAYNYAGIEVSWESTDNYADLTIKGKGTLTAEGGSNTPGSVNGAGGGAGIGGSFAEEGVYGNITIESGTVTAKGGGRSAGIGSSDNPADGTSHGSWKHVDDNPGAWGTITIKGGSVTAKGVGNGAGIGGGNHTSSGTIVISGGTIDARGDSGIGSGLGSSNPSQRNSDDGSYKGPGYYWADVTIKGGTITAHATNNMGAGIGGGMYSDAYVTITGGTVTATVDQGGKEYQGGAGIGGGYQGCAIVKISGGTVTATGGHGAPGIGNGAGAATISPKTAPGAYSDDDWTGTKKIRTGAPTIDGADSGVTISGGTVKAYGGKFSAGIGSGNFTEWCNVTITDGDVYAEGSRSSESEKLGGAGIGSGVTYAPTKAEYMVKTTENIIISGGSVIAIGGWGASGIGSGADGEIDSNGVIVRSKGKQTMANSIEIDADEADIQAYADGTKFAIDTRNLHENGTTTSQANDYPDTRKIKGNLLQGTFVHEYQVKDSEGHVIIDQDPEGLDSIIITNDGTGVQKELTLMPDGYRSYATDVETPGVYTVYTDVEEIGEGEGRYFSQLTTDQYDKQEAEEKGKLVQYTAEANKLSDNFYLFPVKSVVVEKIVQTEGADPGELNATAYFGVCYKDGDEEVFIKDGDQIWRESIEIVNGKPQSKAYFVNLDDRTYDVKEITETGTSSPIGSKFGSLTLNRITTQHGEIIPLDKCAEHGLAATKTESGDQVTITVSVSAVHSDDYSISLSLFANGKLASNSEKLNSDNNWTVSWTVDKYDADGNEIEYGVADTTNNATIDSDHWSDEVKIINTYEGESGKLIIKKTLSDFVDHGNEQLTNVNATFVFQITGTYEVNGETKQYSNVISMDFTKEGENYQEVEVTGIPSSIQDLTVEEVYGGNYSTETPKVANIQKNEDGIYEVSFTNTMADIGYKGGVTNYFNVIDKTGR